MSEQKTMTTYLYLDKWDNLGVGASDLSDYGYITIASKEVTFDVENLDPSKIRQLRIDSLEKNKKALLSDAQVKAADIDEQIKKLNGVGDE